MSSCVKTHKLIVERTNGVVVSRYWLNLVTGSEETDAAVLAQLEASLTNAECDELICAYIEPVEPVINFGGTANPNGWEVSDRTLTRITDPADIVWFGPATEHIDMPLAPVTGVLSKQMFVGNPATLFVASDQPYGYAHKYFYMPEKGEITFAWFADNFARTVWIDGQIVASSTETNGALTFEPDNINPDIITVPLEAGMHEITMEVQDAMGTFFTTLVGIDAEIQFDASVIIDVQTLIAANIAPPCNANVIKKADGTYESLTGDVLVKNVDFYECNDCEQSVTHPASPISLPDVCIEVDGNPMYATPVITFNPNTNIYSTPTYFDREGVEITGEIETANPCDCDCLDCTTCACRLIDLYDTDRGIFTPGETSTFTVTLDGVLQNTILHDYNTTFDGTNISTYYTPVTAAINALAGWNITVDTDVVDPNSGKVRWRLEHCGTTPSTLIVTKDSSGQIDEYTFVSDGAGNITASANWAGSPYDFGPCP